MDIETITINDEMRPYAVSLHDGLKAKSFYLQDYNSGNEMLIDSIKYLMKRKYDRCKVHLHNFSNFYFVFLLSALSSCSNSITPIIKDGRYIEVKFKFGPGYSLCFRDSYLILQGYLRKLAENLDIELNKGIFPYSFVNETVGLDYDSDIPEYKYFDGITLNEYNDYVKDINSNAHSDKHQ